MASVGSDESEATGDRRNLVQSVSRAASLLRCFSEPPAERSMTELAKQTGLTASTAHRLLRTLVEAGFLAHDGATERYSPGPALLELAGAVLTSPEFMGATEILESLALRTGETASLGIRQGNDVVILLQAESTSWLRLNRPVGSRVPLHGSAMGKALLAYGQEPPRRSIESLGELRELTRNTMTAPAKLEADLLDARARLRRRRRGAAPRAPVDRRAHPVARRCRPRRTRGRGSDQPHHPRRRARDRARRGRGRRRHPAQPGDRRPVLTTTAASPDPTGSWSHLEGVDGHRARLDV